MRKKILTFLLAICLTIPCGIILTACGGKDPEKTLSSISVVAVDPDSTSVVYEPNLSEQFALSDFAVTANYSDSSTEEVTEGVTMTSSGTFDCLTNNGKFIFTYQEKTAEVQVYVHERSIEGNDFEVVGLEDSYTLENDQQQITPEITLSWNDKNVTLEEDVDYTVFYGENNYNSLGEDGGNITITGLGNYTGGKFLTFDIIGMSSSASVEFSDSTLTYNGVDRSYEEHLDYNVESNLEGVSYVTYQYSVDDGNTWEDSISMTDVGTYKMRVYFVMDNGYTQLEPKTKTVTINPADISTLGFGVYDSNIEFDNTEMLIDELYDNNKFCVYLGSNQYDIDRHLVFGEDYILDADYEEDGFVGGYKNNKYASTNTEKASFVIKGMGNYTGNKIIEFTISPYRVSRNSRVRIKSFEGSTGLTFDGNAKTPAIELYFDVNDNEMFENDVDLLLTNSDYTCTYYDNIFASKNAYVSCSFMSSNNFEGTFYEYFTINKYKIELGDLEFSNSTLTYNGRNQGPELTGESLEKFVETNSTIAHLFYGQSNLDGVLEIQYLYIDDVFYSDDTKDVGDNYYAHVNLICNDTDNSYLYYNSLELTNNGTTIASNVSALVQKYSIVPFVVTSANAQHLFINEEFNDNSTVSYSGETFTADSKVVVTIADGVTETIEFSNWGNNYKNVGTYVIEAGGLGKNFDVQSEAISDIKFVITKAEITEGKEEDFFELPTVMAIKGNTQTSFQISDFVLNTEKQIANDANECKFEVVSYDVKTKKLELNLISNNYKMEHTLLVEPIYKTFTDLDVFTKVEYSETEDAEQQDREDVTDTFFDDFEVEAGYYWIYLGEREKYSYSFSQRTRSTIGATEFDEGIKLHFEDGEYWAVEPTYEFKPHSGYSSTFSCSLNLLTFYCGANPISKVTNTGINDVYALTRETYFKNGNNEKNVYLLYSIGSGEKYGTNYAFDDFFVSGSHLTVSTGSGYYEHPYLGHIIDIYLDSPYTYDGVGMEDTIGKLVTTNTGTVDEDFDIQNFKQQPFYIKLMGRLDSNPYYKSIIVKFSENTLIKTNDAHVDIVDRNNLGGYYAYVNANAGRDVQVNSNLIKVWNGTDYVDGYIYISEKGYLTVSEELLTEPIDQAGTEDSGKYIYVAPICATYSRNNVNYTVYTNLTIYRESFYTKDNITFNYIDDLQRITDYNIVYTIEGKYNYVYGDTDCENNAITKFSAYRYSPQELLTFEELQQLNLDYEFNMKNFSGSGDILAQKYTCNSAELITIEVNGVNRHYVKVDYSCIIGDIEYNNCYKLIEVICAA